MAQSNLVRESIAAGLSELDFTSFENFGTSGISCGRVPMRFMECTFWISEWVATKLLTHTKLRLYTRYYGRAVELPGVLAN